MSSKPRARISRRSPAAATVFAALGDPTRLALVTKLCAGSALSITHLSEGEAVSRQAISKHLRVLADADLVHSQRSGRETLFALNPGPIADIKSYLELVAEQWDGALGRLKSLVEH